MTAGFLVPIKGRHVTYFPAGDKIAPVDSETIGFDFSEDAEFRLHTRLRRVLTTLVRPTPTFYGVLHWSDGSDLNLLDHKVKSGLVTDADFSNALLAEPRTIVCHACQAQVRVLAVDTGQALFAGDLAERLRGHALKTSCPACGAPLSLPVVEFIGE